MQRERTGRVESTGNLLVEQPADKLQRSACSTTYDACQNSPPNRRAAVRDATARRIAKERLSCPVAPAVRRRALVARHGREFDACKTPDGPSEPFAARLALGANMRRPQPLEKVFAIHDFAPFRFSSTVPLAAANARSELLYQPLSSMIRTCGPSVSSIDSMSAAIGVTALPNSRSNSA